MWRQPPLSGQPPSARERHESVFAADQSAIYFFGGVTSSGLTNELWMLTIPAAVRGPEISRNGVVNAYSGEGGAVAPGEAVSIRGTGLGPIDGIWFGLDSATGRLPTAGPGVSVIWNGIPAPLYFARADQLIVQVPYELDGELEASLVVTVLGAPSEAIRIPVVRTRRGLFPLI